MGLFYVPFMFRMMRTKTKMTWVCNVGSPGKLWSGTWKSIDGCSGSLLSGGDTHSDWLHDFANTVVSKGHSRCCLRMLNQNRHYWTPPKWLGSSAVCDISLWGQHVNVCICVLICWASFEIKGLCMVLNRNWFRLMSVHTWVSECVFVVVFLWHLLGAT